MRTTLRIDADLIATLKKMALRKAVPLTKLVNDVIRRGLEASHAERRKTANTYQEQAFSMGQPAVNLNKALDLASRLEDEEILEKIARRK